MLLGTSGTMEALDIQAARRAFSGGSIKEGLVRGLYWFSGEAWAALDLDMSCDPPRLRLYHLVRPAAWDGEAETWEHRRLRGGNTAAWPGLLVHDPLGREWVVGEEVEEVSL